ncbi:MAG: hypothetical protein WBG47_15030 [Gordonia sp. (in: high G+C Gram-positive bacteria)]|uniref:hypothetical protein n=1 Tax=Gordonia sp. (in: high G+C Gram-positive bacteria) TaxID=84139 RepID=UPI003C742864
MTAPITTTVPLTIRVENSYANGDAFTHVLDISISPPTPTTCLTDWALDELIPFTGEGPQYANTEAIYEVEILAAPDAFAHLVGLAVTAEG